MYGLINPFSNVHRLLRMFCLVKIIKAEDSAWKTELANVPRVLDNYHQNWICHKEICVE